MNCQHCKGLGCGVSIVLHTIQTTRCFLCNCCILLWHDETRNASFLFFPKGLPKVIATLYCCDNYISLRASLKHRYMRYNTLCCIASGNALWFFLCWTLWLWTDIDICVSYTSRFLCTKVKIPFNWTPFMPIGVAVGNAQCRFCVLNTPRCPSCTRYWTLSFTSLFSKPVDKTQCCVIWKRCSHACA